MTAPLIYIPSHEAHFSKKRLPSLSLRQHWEANRDKVKSYDLALHGRLINAGEDYEACDTHTHHGYPTAPEPGYSFIYYHADGNKIMDFLPQKEFETATINISSQSYATPRMDIPAGLEASYNARGFYEIKCPGSRFLTVLRPPEYTSRFNDAAADARPTGYITFGLRDAMPVRGIVLAEDTSFFRLTKDGMRHIIHPAGSFLQPAPLTSEGYELASPDFTHLSLRVAKPREHRRSTPSSFTHSTLRGLTRQ